MAYQVPFAERVKAKVGLPKIAVGLITDPEKAKKIVANRQLSPPNDNHSFPA